MLRYVTVAEAIRHEGLRIVIVQGMPSPWSQAAKTFFELKGLDYVAAPYVVGGTNDEVVAWSGQNSAPVVAWQDEPPIHRWIDILNLVERLAPEPALLPSGAHERALVIGLSNEICGELGIGWNRRLELFAPAMEAGTPPEGIARMSAKYGYRRADAERAAARTAESLRALAGQLHAQYDRGVEFFVGDRLSALDVYWTAFANLLDPLPKEQCPMPEDWRPGFVARDPQILEALDPLLLRHRDRIFRRCFRSPMEF
jgi:glutathione S-transferase